MFELNLKFKKYNILLINYVDKLPFVSLLNLSSFKTFKPLISFMTVGI